MSKVYKYKPKGNLYGLRHVNRLGMEDEIEREVVKNGREYIYFAHNRRAKIVLNVNYHPQCGEMICSDECYDYYHTCESRERAKKTKWLLKEINKVGLDKLGFITLGRVAYELGIRECEAE